MIVGEDELRLVLVRGDHRVNDIKLGNALGAPFRPAHEAEFADRIGPAGYIGPVGIDVPILLDSALSGDSYIAGANKADAHLRGVKPGRDFAFTEVDVRTVEAGDTVDGHAIRIEPAIEIGNIFKLGTRYSVPLGATYLDESGTSQPVWMGSYGIGPARIAAAAVEQFADEKGISWPRSLAPFDVHLVGLGKPDTEEFALAETALRASCARSGWTSSTTTATSGRAAKFADAELLGVPAAADGRQAHDRGGRDRGAGPARARDPLRAARGGGAGRAGPVGDAPVKRKLTFRRLSGLDRSGPPPPETVAGAPLRPWTIPNAIGYVRLR